MLEKCVKSIDVGSDRMFLMCPIADVINNVWDRKTLIAFLFNILFKALSYENNVATIDIAPHFKT